MLIKFFDVNDMKLIKAAIILLVFFTTISAQNCNSVLEIKTNNQNAFIFINEKFVGNGNISISLTPNLYQILIRESLYKWNGEEIIDTVKIDECEKKYFSNYKINEKKFLDSYPQDAVISYLGNIIGYTPTYVNIESYDSLEVVKGSSKFVIRRDEMLEGSLIKFDYKSNIKNGSFSDSDLFKILIGSSVIFGSTAAYFKIIADKKYDEYLITKDKKTLEKVNKLDLYSGIAFGLLQVNFGYLIYKFLIE